ncbi:hypothetical protein [Pontibacter anaerobius]|uniref:Glycosyltransferase RgtA/B/C/D-like domain-containing protein n=1 Tax=Pontibacter anaerobius TaxID=2993940 RepID=A0ABT3RBY6_9BACT|nr:hypothetical protein [Pontibacter anaerobius]MCX2738877.1 hypothetical protein [Pontibacter anaerobius]
MSIFLVYLFNLLILAGFTWWMSRQNWAQELKPYFWPALALKLLLVLVLAVLFYYGLMVGDRNTYHQGSIQLWQYARQEPGAYLKLLFFNEFASEQVKASFPFTDYADHLNSFFFIKLLSLLNFATAGSYLLNNLYLAIYSFWGSAYLVAVLAGSYPKYKTAGAIAFLFFPTVLIWSVGLLKDPLMYGSMSWLTGAALALAHRQRFGWGGFLLLPLHFYLFVKIRMFYAALLVPLLLVYVLVQRLKVRHTSLQPLRAQLLFYAVLGVVAVGLVALVFRDKLLVDYLPLYIHKSYAAMLPRALGKPHVALEGLQPALQSMFLHYPEAMISSIYRPFIGESWKPLYLLAGLENLLLLLLTGLAFASAFRKGANIKPELLHVVLLVFILVMAGVTGLSTPNFGTLSRYRIVYLPFLVYLLLQNVYAQRLLQRFRLL